MTARAASSSTSPLLELAAEIRPDDAGVLYDLGCAWALAGDRKRALATLGKSVAAGFTDAAHMKSDPDLVSLRESKAFAELLGKLAGKPPS